LVVGYLIQQLANYIRVARFKKQHKCEPETQIPQPERIIGYKLYKTQMEASKNKNLLEAGRQRYIDNGNTWSGIMMGRVSFSRYKPRTNDLTSLRNSSIRSTQKTSRPFSLPISKISVWDRGKRVLAPFSDKESSRRVCYPSPRISHQALLTETRRRRSMGTLKGNDNFRDS
jgi:hypothetical protein